MSDNTTLGGSSDVVRDIDRSGVKTQVVQLDVGGATAESLVSSANPLPVTNLQVQATNQALLRVHVAQLSQQVAMSQFAAGFFPIEVPAFLGG